MKQFSNFTLRFSNYVSLNKVLNINNLKCLFLSYFSVLSHLGQSLDQFCSMYSRIYFRISHLKFKKVFHLPTKTIEISEYSTSPADFTGKIKVTVGQYLSLLPMLFPGHPLLFSISGRNGFSMS